MAANIVAPMPVITPVTNHRRDHRSILADSEKRLLVGIARRLPRWVTSDHLTAIGVAGMFVAGAGFALMRVTPAAGWIVLAGLATNWFGDSLDGTLARVRGCERPQYGFYVDHVLDLAGATSLCTGLALSGVMAPAITAALLVAYLLVSAEIYLATCVSSVFKMSFFWFGPTELRIVLAIGVLKVMNDPWVTVAGLGRERLFDVGGVIAAAGLVVVFVYSFVRQTRQLARAEN